MKPYLKYVFLGLAVVVVFGIYLYNKPHKNVSRSTPDFIVDAKTLFTEFEEQEEASNTKYLDKVIQVTGVVREVVADDEGRVSVTLDTGNDFMGVICELQETSKLRKEDFQAGQELTFKGLCSGMLMDVVLSRCVLISKPEK